MHVQNIVQCFSRYYFRTKKCFCIIYVFVLRIATTNFKQLAAYDDNHVKIMIS